MSRKAEMPRLKGETGVSLSVHRIRRSGQIGVQNHFVVEKNGYPTTTDNHLLLIPFAGLPKKASLRWSQSVGGSMVLTRIKFVLFGVSAV